MPHLSVRGFCCLDRIDMEIGPVTVLIGPQASGKSIISKLFYFFGDIFKESIDAIDGDSNYKIFLRGISKNFTEWFPPSTWGNKPFSIVYEAGPARINIDRRMAGVKLLDEVVVDGNKYVRDLYAFVDLNYKKNKSSLNRDEDFWSLVSTDVMWNIAREVQKNLDSDLGIENMSDKIFVPAGRSFYTNLGKAIAILEHGSQLDEVTKRFGRMFTFLLGGRPASFRESSRPGVRDFVRRQKVAIERIFGAEIKLARNDMHAATRDGRKIPLGLLSSGQQELLPLILILSYFTSLVSRRKESDGGSYLFVEEPEAHLFPEAQGLLTQQLVEVANFADGAGRMLITTHSPYVLAKMNNLIQAFLVGASNRSVAEQVEKIVPEAAWLSPSNLRAYAIDNGRLRSIKDETGLIDGAYLDNISNDMNSDFMQLLEIESKI